MSLATTTLALTRLRDEPQWKLTAAELDLLVGLQQGRWGDRLRLEQERVHWPTAEVALDRVLPPRVDGGMPASVGAAGGTSTGSQDTSPTSLRVSD